MLECQSKAADEMLQEYDARSRPVTLFARSFPLKSNGCSALPLAHRCGVEIEYCWSVVSSSVRVERRGTRCIGVCTQVGPCNLVFQMTTCLNDLHLLWRLLASDAQEKKEGEEQAHCVSLCLPYPRSECVPSSEMQERRVADVTTLAQIMNWGQKCKKAERRNRGAKAL